MSLSLQVVSSINIGSTASSNTGGTTAVNATGSSTTTPNAINNGNPLIYVNNLTDPDYKNYYTSINPALPREFTGVGVVSITGLYTGTGNNIRIISSSIQISFTEGLVGSLPVSFSGPISGPGTTLSLQNLFGITNPTVQPNGPTNLPLNLTIRIFGATIEGGNLTATISVQFTPAFVNLDSSIQYKTLAPGFIFSNFSGGRLTGSSGTLTTIAFNSRTITHNLF